MFNLTLYYRLLPSLFTNHGSPILQTLRYASQLFSYLMCFESSGYPFSSKHAPLVKAYHARWVKCLIWTYRQINIYTIPLKSKMAPNNGPRVL